MDPDGIQILHSHPVWFSTFTPTPFVSHSPLTKHSWPSSTVASHKNFLIKDGCLVMSFKSKLGIQYPYLVISTVVHTWPQLLFDFFVISIRPVPNLLISWSWIVIALPSACSSASHACKRHARHKYMYEFKCTVQRLELSNLHTERLEINFLFISSDIFTPNWIKRRKSLNSKHKELKKYIYTTHKMHLVLPMDISMYKIQTHM